MVRLIATGTAKALRPAGCFQSGLALRLRAELLDKRGQRQTPLELDAIHGHDSSLLDDLETSMRLLLEKTGLAEECF